MRPDERILPAHIEETVERIARLHAEHERDATSMQRIIHHLTAFIGKPVFVGCVTAFMLAWILENTVAARSGHAFDPPPFAWLDGIISALAFYVTLLILGTQQRDDVLASQREQLTLELAILSEQKSAKIIQLLEDLRRDHPDIENRIDAEALTMSIPTDPGVVLEAIKESQSEANPAKSKEPG